jgi:hypothetical protein
MGFKGVILGYAKEIVVDRTIVEEREVADEKGTSSADKQDTSCDGIASWEKGVMTTVEMIGEDDFLALK